MGLGTSVVVHATEIWVSVRAVSKSLQIKSLAGSQQ